LAEPVEHTNINWAVFYASDGWTVCSCGAHWSMKPGSTKEQVDSLFASHVAYAARMVTRVD
jgi:hypothetical protein